MAFVMKSTIIRSEQMLFAASSDRRTPKIVQGTLFSMVPD